MKANYGKMIVGVIIGIMAATTLTLNVWGAEWYKLLTSTVAGLIIGMLIADYHVTVNIFKTGLQTAANNSWKRAERIKNGEISPEQQHEFDVSIIKGMYIFLILSLIATLVIILLTAVYKFYLLSLESTGFLLSMAIAGFLIRIYVLIIGALEFDNWAKKLDEFQIEKIWNKKPGKNGKNSLTYDYEHDVKIGFEELTANMSFKEIMCRVLASFKALAKRDLINDWEYIITFLRMVVVFILAIILFLTTSLPVLPFWIIKQISKHGHLLNVAAAITIGSVTGTLTRSQLIGLGIGLGFMAISYLIERLFKKIDVFYMYRKNRLVDKVWNWA